MTQVTKTGYVEPTVKVDTSQKKQESSKTNIPKTIGKTALNVATNMGEGALKTLENVADTASDVVFNPIERKANYVYDFITKGKKVADENIKDLAQMQQRDIKKNLVNELNQATGWNQMKDQWEKDSLVKSGNFGGQVAQGIGGMVPSLVVGGAFGAKPALTNTSNLAGKEKLIASLGNVGKTYASQLPANTILGASSYGSGMEEALNQGATIDQARKYGLANAAIEQATEMMTGGIPGLGGKGGIDNYVEPLINKNTNSYLNALLKAGYGALGEGLEESTGTYLEALAKKGILGQDIDWNEVNKEALQSGLTGSTIGAILNAPSNIQNIRDVKTENQIRNAIGDAEYAEGNQQYNPEYKGWEEQRYANELKERKKQKEIQNRERIAREAQIKAQESQNQQESTNILEQPKTLAETQKKAQEKLIRDEEYNKYYKKADLDKFDDNYVSKAKEVISANKQGKRTKQEWLDVADNIGMQLRGQDPETIKKYAYESFKSERPNVKENLNRQGQRYVGFKVDEWVDAVEKSANVGAKQEEVNITPTENVAEKVEQPMIKSNEYQNESFDKRLEKYKYNNLTNEQKSKILELKESLEKSNAAVDTMFSDDKRQAEKVKYGNIMQTEAQIREIIQGDSFDLIENGLTLKELQKKLDKENSNYIGKQVLVDGQKGKILSSAYGNYKIQLDNGDVITKKKDGFEALNKVPKNVSEVNKVTFEPNESSQQNLKSNTQVDTGVSIGNKPVTMQIPADSKPNKLGQYIPKDGFSKIENGKIGDSKFYKNVTERSDFIKDEVRQKVKNDNSIKQYKKVTNEESMQMAFDDLNTRGTEAIADFFNNNKELTSKDTAMGWLLIEQSQENGDYEFSNQVLRKMRSNATKIGQAEQMYNYYARLTPEGMYRWCGDQLLRAEEIFKKNKTNKWIENNKDRWQLNGKETEFIKSQMEKVQKLNQMNDSDTTTIEVKGKQKQVSVERAKQVEIAKVQAMIENKLPPEKGQALNAWMRIAMLGNLKTIGTRNPLGNAALRPINDVGDFFSSLVDVAISKKTGVRTKGNLNLKAQLKGAKQGVFGSIQDFLMGIDTKNSKGNRFEVGSGKSFNERHQGIGKVLNPLAKLGNKADSYVSFLLDLGDRPFYDAAYRQSLENQMKLNKIDNVDNIPDWIKNIAEQEALERTYQDDNNYTSAVVDIRKAMNKFNVKGYGLGDVIIPFAKTPANITKAIVDYSPAGLVSALTKGNQLRTAINNGQFTPEMQHAFVNQLGKATAGTILYAIGAALANSGVITGGADEDKDVADFMRNTLGIQPYSIKIGDKTFTYDWAQPVASGLAIPADIKKSLEDTKEEEVDLEYIIHKSFNTAGSILLEQSFLQGIKDVLGGYGDPLDNLMSEIEGLPARAIPTLFQQITTYIDPTKRMSYGNEGLENVTSQAIAKTPLGSSLPVYRNSLGKEIKMYGGKNTFFNVFLNPANYSEGNASRSAEEIYRVYQATNDKTILPRLVESSMKNEDGTKLTNQQKSDFLEISGNIIEKNVAELLNDEEYDNMSDEDKAQVIKYIVDYAYNKARNEITGHKLSSTYSKAEQAENSGYAIADYYISKKTNKTTKSTTSSSNNRYQELADKGISGEIYDDFKAFVSTAKGESSSGGLTKKQKIINYIESLPLTAQQKQSLYQDYLDNTGIFTYYK